MQHSKIIELLQKLNSRTLTRFQEYVESPYFNKHEAIIALCKYLLKDAPIFKNKQKIDKKRIYKNLFPKDSFDEKKINRLVSQLLQLLHQFLIDENWQEQKNARTIVLLEELRNLKLEKHYHSIQKQYHQVSESTALNSSDFLKNQYRFHKELDSLFIEKGGRVYHENLQFANDYLDYFFILEKLKMACEMASRNKVIQANYQWSMITEIEAYLQSTAVVFPPIIQIYYTIFQMLSNDEEKAALIYQTLKKLLNEHSKEFTKEEVMQIYGYALNYAIGQINKKGSIYLVETLALYQYLVESEAIFVGGYLMPQEYKNIVTLGLRLEKYEWTKTFIEQYKSKLPADTRNNAYSYNLASLQHSSGDFKAALHTLHHVDFINNTYYLGTKIIQLKIFYELNETEAFYSLIDACMSYLRRSDTVAEYQIKSTTNLLKFAKKLYKIKDQEKLVSTNKTESAIKKLKTALQICNFVANKDWLEACLKKLELNY